MALSSDPKTRKSMPMFSGFLRYFPHATAAVAQLSLIANEQHHPGTELHWDREKSKDELDALMRHLVDYASYLEGSGESLDGDGVHHAVKIAWRAMANLERLILQDPDAFAVRLPDASV